MLCKCVKIAMTIGIISATAEWSFFITLTYKNILAVYHESGQAV